VGQTARPLLLIAAGGLAGAVSHRVVQRTAHPVVVSGLSLVAAAVTYPLTDPRGQHGPARQRELAGVGATVLVGVASLLAPRRARHRILATGWVAHAAFDAVHHRNSSSQLPDWYPAVCAGFDVAVASALVMDARS
jgi:hypothetical protein